MSRLLVVGRDGPVADAFAGALRAGLADDALPVADAAVVLALPDPAGPVGRLGENRLAELVHDAVALPALAIRRLVAAGVGRIVVVCPSCGVLPDHLDGARSVAAAGTAMLGDVASALPGATVNVVAVGDDVPPAGVATLVTALLEAPSLNGATIRLDGGRDAVLDVQTRADGA